MVLHMSEMFIADMGIMIESVYTLSGATTDKGNNSSQSQLSPGGSTEQAKSTTASHGTNTSAASPVCLITLISLKGVSPVYHYFYIT